MTEKMSDSDRLASYTRMIARKRGGLEGLNGAIERIAVYRSERAGLEAVGARELLDDGIFTAARSAIEDIERRRSLAPAQIDALEAIIDADLRPAIDIEEGTFTSSHPLWAHLSSDAEIRGRIEAALQSIGRIELPGHPRLPYGGTGFIVGEGLVMTNRHVAEIFATGVGTGKHLGFRPGARAGIDFLRERSNAAGTVFRVRDVLMVHPYWDMALLAVDGLSARGGLALSLEDARDLDGHDIAVIGYPAFDPRNDAADMQQVYSGRFGIKRLQPGELHGGVKTGSFGKSVNAATHDSSTLGGCSGAAVLDLATGTVLALHFGGRYKERNYAVPSLELSKDARVTQAGVTFAGTPSTGVHDWAAWWVRADAGESVSGANGDAGTNSRGADSDGDARRDSSAGFSAPGAGIGAGAGTLRVEIPIIVTVMVGETRSVDVVRGEPASTGAAVATVRDAESMEAMVEPYRDTRYANRAGYDENFLDPDGSRNGTLRVPMPTAADPRVLAPTRMGEDILQYQNFSIRMHAKRRLALVTGSNVTMEPKLRRPEGGKLYTRAGLSGLGKNDVEKWFIDPRMEEKYQIPDVFLTKDRKAFDKGHIVRRDDVAWGKTYAALRRANGDSYHVTNCSPQVSGYNQSAKGEANWGDLENQILSEAESERLCLFAGPVLDPNDRVFHGVGDAGVALRSRIPARFWKVVVSRMDGQLAAFGFVLEQDLDEVEFEYVPTVEFIPSMKPIAEIAVMTGVRFDKRIVDADQFDAIFGIELVYRTGITRSS
jgi:endonuclease G, mitochondrial